MYDMLRKCRQYRQALGEMRGPSGESKIASKEPLGKVFTVALRDLRAHPQDASFDLRGIYPEWFSTEGTPLQTASCVSDTDSGLDYLDEEVRKGDRVDRELEALMADDFVQVPKSKHRRTRQKANKKVKSMQNANEKPKSMKKASKKVKSVKKANKKDDKSKHRRTRQQANKEAKSMQKANEKPKSTKKARSMEKANKKARYAGIRPP
jgi:flagellar biosynthesis GTPase FlhF